MSKQSQWRPQWQIFAMRSSRLRGVFEVLKDTAFFQKAYVEDGYVTWPGELDLAPDAMYHEIKAHGEWVLK